MTDELGRRPLQARAFLSELKSVALRWKAPLGAVRVESSREALVSAVTGKQDWKHRSAEEETKRKTNVSL